MTDQSTVQNRRWANTAEAYADAEHYCDEMTGDTNTFHCVIVEYFASPFPVPQGELGELHTFASESESNLLSAVANASRGREYDIQYETGPTDETFIVDLPNSR